MEDDDSLKAAYDDLKVDADAKAKDTAVRKAFTNSQAHIKNAFANGRGDCSSVELKQALFLYAFERSVKRLPGYSTLNFEHTQSVKRFQESIEGYLGDKTRTRPNNWLITASPGEGKSHLVTCIASIPSLKDKLDLVLFNMASMLSPADLVLALDDARNVAVEGKIPLLFLDEVDFLPTNYGLLLPLLWDGVIQSGSRKIRIGRAVIVLAGSTEQLTKDIRSMSQDERKKLPEKLPDFLSRINGRLPIPSLRPVRSTEPGSRTTSRSPDVSVDRVCVAIALLRHIYRNQFRTRSEGVDNEVRWVPARLLNFIYTTPFKYGVRSITHLIDLLRQAEKSEVGKDWDDSGVLRIDRLDSIFKTTEGIVDAGLHYHVFPRHDEDEDAEQAQEIQAKWAAAGQIEGNLPIWCGVFRKFGQPDSWDTSIVQANNQQVLIELREGVAADDFVLVGLEGIGRLWFRQKLGQWVHGRGALRHIFFNLSTIQTILSAVADSDTVKEDLGLRMGKAFGADFVKYLHSEQPDIMERNAKIDAWCRYDISGGWGHWDHDKTRSAICVLNNFLAEPIKSTNAQPSKKGDHSGFCTIMRGYIKGVLTAIEFDLSPDKEPSVWVREDTCGIFPDPKTTPCVFEYGFTSASESQ